MTKYPFSCIPLLLALLLCMACDGGSGDASVTPLPLQLGVGTPSADTRGRTDVQNTLFNNAQKVDVFISENGTQSITYEQPIVYATTQTKDEDGFYALSDPHDKNNNVIDASLIVWPNSNSLNIYGYYPSKKVTSASSSTTSTFTVASDQSSDANYMASDLMEGEPAEQGVKRQSGRIPLTFTHLLSKVVITLRGDRSLNIGHDGWRTSASAADKAAAQEAADLLLKGAKVELQDIQPAVTLTPPKALSAASGAKTTITVGTISSTTERVSEGSQKGAWQMACIVPPQTLSSRKLIKVTMPAVNSVAGGILYYTGTADFKSGNQYVYNITVKSTQLDVTASIKAWENGDTRQALGETPVITF